MVKRLLIKRSYHSFGSTTPLNRYCGTLAVLCSPNPLKTIAISTEGIDGLIVRCTVERSRNFAVAVACPFPIKPTPEIVILSEVVRFFGNGAVEGPAVAFAVVFLLPYSETVISTEAARAFACSAVEKSASLPQSPSRCLCFRCCLSYPRINLLLYLILAFIFHVFGPKIACQVTKPPKPLQTNNIHVAF
jgi:hypothetical protein